MAQIKKVTTEEGERKSIAESTADIIQKIFTSCLMDRSSTRWTQPKGKKAGVYLFANLVLKLLISVRGICVLSPSSVFYRLRFSAN